MTIISSGTDSVKELIKAGRLGDAGQAAYQAAVTGRADAETLGLGAQAAYQAGVDDMALDLFARLDARAALDASQWAMMGHAAERLGTPRIALRAYHRSLDQAPDNPAVHYNLGSLYLRRHQWTEAIRHLQTACDAKPDWEAAWENLVQAMMGTEHYETVIPFLKDCMARFSDNATFYFQHAEALMNMGDRAAAEAAYRTLTELAPQEATAWAGLAAAVIQDGRKDEAATIIAQAASAGAASPDLEEMAATLKLDAGDAVAAKAGYEAVLATTPGHRLARINLIDALVQAGDHEQALGICDERLAEIPGDPEMLAYRAVVLTDMGRADEAEAFLPPDLIMGHRPMAPDGFASMADFNKEMVRHILSHPSLVPSPPSHATVQGRHTGSLVCEPWGPMQHFKEMIAEAARVYRRRHRNSDHPVFTRWSDEYSLTLWAVEMNAGGHQMPHIHPSGFLSGVYYPQLPRQVTDPDDTKGFIEFFQAPEQFKLRHAPRLQLFAPEEGGMYLFPSAYFHRTIPFEGDGTRISVAFDLVAL
ncbi:MAG: tetratricopeptide repeat protein [Rhodospirillales bacterium]